MKNFKVILLRRRDPMFLLGRYAIDYLKAEFECCSPIFANGCQLDDMFDVDGINVVLDGNMPLVTLQTIENCAALMKRRGYKYLSLGGKNSTSYISIGSPQKSDVFIRDDAFISVDDAQSFAAVYDAMRRRIIDRAILSGAIILNPQSVSLDATVSLGEGCVIFDCCRLEGDTRVSAGAKVGMSYLKDSFVGEFADVRFSHIDKSRIGKNATVGPFARLRGADIGDGVRVGDFVEVKASRLDDGVKASHLAYIGDAFVGEKTNVGCGSVFCNYDGKQKHKSVVGKNCFIGANVNLVAPIEVGDGAYIAAGATCSKDIAPNTFTIARGQRPETATKRGGDSPQ